MMRNGLLNGMILLIFLLGLGGCVGTLEIWGVNRPLSSDDDDDDDVPDIDFSDYNGDEFLNVRWDKEQAQAGYFDCQEAFAVTGTEEDVGSECPFCDVVWAVTLDLIDLSAPCLSQGTDLDVAPSYNRIIGMEFHREGPFSFYRSTADSGSELGQVGVGAFNGTDFTWSGVGDWEEPFSASGFTLFYSGEGSF